ncbi:MAG: peptide deformylase [Chlorobiota bacterium]
MSILRIYNCFHPILREKAEKVDKFDQELKDFTDSMLETMYNADGIGLAANQVGDRRAIFTVDINTGSEDKSKYTPIVMINPSINSFSEEVSTFQEGCLSIPKYYEDVDRPESIQITYTDVDMKEKTIEADEILARVIQHEYDHLKGILFFDRITQLKKTLGKKKLNKIKKGEMTTFYPMINADGSEFEPNEEK